MGEWADKAPGGERPSTTCFGCLAISPLLELRGT